MKLTAVILLFVQLACVSSAALIARRAADINRRRSCRYQSPEELPMQSAIAPRAGETRWNKKHGGNDHESIATSQRKKYSRKRLLRQNSAIR
jgi:hypothetical protein